MTSGYIAGNKPVKKECAYIILLGALALLCFGEKNPFETLNIFISDVQNINPEKRNVGETIHQGRLNKISCFDIALQHQNS